MSKMACRCGHIISDVRCPSPTEGRIVREQDNDTFLEELTGDIARYYGAVQQGERTEWLMGYFSEIYPVELSDAAVIDDICVRHFYDKTLSVCECENCGRLWVQQASGENIYRSYAPDESGYHAVLRSPTYKAG